MTNSIEGNNTENLSNSPTDNLSGSQDLKDADRTSETRPEEAAREDHDGGSPYEEDMSDDIEALKEELAKISVTSPKIEPPEVFDSADFPDSYKNNLPKEKLMLEFADNFRRQYVHLYRDRKPLLLNPVNECLIEKVVCTTIRPTQLPFEELYNWEGAAEFVADYLNFTTLDTPYELPERMLSPNTVLKRQKGNCFEYGTVLCSLLVSAGYDAYVVSGYATREVCNADETRELCPLTKKREMKKVEEIAEEIKKYAVKAPRDLQSRFEIKMEKRRQEESEAEQQKARLEEDEKLLELEKPPPDPLRGLRIHSWVLILSGKREVPESFFVEPFTGLPQPTNSQNYLGIESLWNHMNYWVNMQDCSNGVQDLIYDLGDCTKWEFMLPSNDKPLLQMTLEADEEPLDLDDEDEGEDDIERHLDVPPSWCVPLELSEKDFELRCPQGKKTKYYKRSKLEKFAQYLMKDGLNCRLSMFDDKELTDLISVKEFFEHRLDKLYLRQHQHRMGWVTEQFHPGRQRCLKEHQYKASSPGPETERTMVFYSEARVDGLAKRIETSAEMTEHYTDRPDFLYYRYVELGKRPKKFGPQEGAFSSANARPILKIVQRFERDKSKPANKDIAELMFLVSEDRIQITYHTDDKRIASSTRDFLKPSNWDEKGATLTMTADMHTTFQVDPSTQPLKQVEQYLMLMDLLKLEDQAREKVRESEMEVRDIINERTHEEAVSELEISVYDTDRNEKAKKHRKELERQQLEEKMRKQEMELDYLAPFLAQIGDPEKISRSQAYKLKEDCLADLKQRLIDKANLIQARFEKETQELQKKQAWYQQNQVSMQKDDEEEYLNYCSEAMFRIHILELRLNRHKEMAPHKYMALEQKMRSDPRLAEFF